MSRIIDYLRLMRASNVLTAASNVLMGFLLVRGSWQPLGPLVLLLMASCCLYLAGMALNDLFDFEVDRRERPERPLPSGKISRKSAAQLGFGLLLAGTALAVTSGVWGALESKLIAGWKSGVIGVSLATLILVYDSGGKGTWLGPVLMGTCRSLNVLLGCSLADKSSSMVFGMAPVVWMVAIGIGVYITGVTWLARREATTSGKGQLFGAACVMGVGGATLLLFPTVYAWDPSHAVAPHWVYVGLLTVILFTVGRRLLVAIIDPSPVNVQRAVVVSLWTLIMIDAAICFLVAPAQPVYAVTVALLLIPTFVLGRWIRAT